MTLGTFFLPSFPPSLPPPLAVGDVDTVSPLPPSLPPSHRHLVGGMTNELDGTWVSGFFDKNSFIETLAGWAKTVVVGRARLGGIPCGVIITETRTAEATTPADPADSSSQER